MASVTPILRLPKKDKKGRCPIWLRISDRNGTRFLSLGEKVLPSQWNPRTGRVRAGHKNADLINRLIEKKIDQAQEEILRLKLDDEYATAKHLKDKLNPSTTAPNFLDFWERHLKDLEKRGQVGRYRRLKATKGKVEEFARSQFMLPLTFDKLTIRFLNDFETYCLAEQKNLQSTVATNLSDIRSLVNRAISEGLIDHAQNPFLRFIIKQGDAPDRTKLSFKEVQAIQDLKLDKDSLIWHVRNVFLFAFYAAGIRFADLALMTAGKIATGADGEPDRLLYRMGKTGKLQSVKITPPARRILDHYMTEGKKEDDFIFPLLTGYDLKTPRDFHNAKSSQNALCNKYLRKIAELAKIKKSVSMHVARHSFANAARTAGWSVYDISKALQHSSIAMTERYLKAFDSNTLDQRLDELFGATTSAETK